MGDRTRRESVWTVAARQHGVITRRQLLELGYTAAGIHHRVAKGRLHPLHRGVYAVGRPQITTEGHWMSAVLACGTGAALSHVTAAALWEICPQTRDPIHVSVPVASPRARRGLVVHRRPDLATTTRRRIPVTTPLRTIVDLAASLPRDDVEAAINQADKLNLITPDALRDGVQLLAHRPGVAVLKHILDRRTFALTDSRLERLFLQLVRRAGLPLPQTQANVNGFRVDFFWPDLGLVVETDGLRYHRTAAQQLTDRLRDQRHTAAGLTVLRFTHDQVVHEPDHGIATLIAIGRRLSGT